jgi:RNA polymerase sigma-70 factor (ECF subfamily)
MELDDQALVVAYQEGDTNAFGVLYDRYIKKIYTFIYYKTFDAATAEDLTSTTFFKALEKIDTLDLTRGSFATWLYRIARNTVIDHYRKHHFDAQSGEDVFDLSEENRAPHDLDARHALGVVEEYLSKLTPAQREIITLRIWEERSYKEIAEIVGGTEGSVKMAFSRTIRALRHDLGPYAPLALVLLCGMGVTYLSESRIPFI